MRDGRRNAEPVIPPVAPPASPHLVLAENRGGHSFLIQPGGGEPVDLGPGRVVEGDDNVTFGHWTALVAWSPATRSFRMIPAHGGEVLPGRLSDHIAALLAGIRDGRPQPVQLDLDITMACASACTFCFSAGYRADGGSGRHLSWPALERTLRSAAGMGVRVVRFDGGGDPLVSPHFAAAVDLCRQLGLTSAVLTAPMCGSASMRPPTRRGISCTGPRGWAWCPYCGCSPNSIGCAVRNTVPRRWR
jgi:hypothetical protein